MAVKVTTKSKSFSFQNWNILEFLKGRKKLLVTAVGAVLGYMITDNATVGIVAGSLVEMGFAIAEYYIKERK